MHKIYSVALNLHDHNTYDGVFIIKEKDLLDLNTIYHIKHQAEAYAHQSDILNPIDYRLNDEFVKEYFKRDDRVFAFTYTYGGIRKCKDELFKTILKGHDEILDWEPKKLLDHYYKDGVYYIDHHQSHAMYAFINSQYEQSIS